MPGLLQTPPGRHTVKVGASQMNKVEFWGNEIMTEDGGTLMKCSGAKECSLDSSGMTTANQ